MNQSQPPTLPKSPRPPFPPETMARRRPTFQFPKTLLLPARRWIAGCVDRGWLPGTALKQQIVICGFPRSGTTLLQLLLESCTKNLGTFGKERRAIEIASAGIRSHAVVLTKRPKDIFLIPEIADWHRKNGSQALFILLHRDPRCVLTSKHFSSPQQYYLSCSDWQFFHQHWEWSRHRSDVLSVSYELLTSNPSAVQEQINCFTRLEAECCFLDFQSRVPQNFDLRALNGLRQTETSRISSWNAPEHAPRIEQIHREIPELNNILTNMGYQPSQMKSAA